VKAAIAFYPDLAEFYDVGVDYIRGANGTEYLFHGLRHNMSAIKSMSNIDLCIIEEAEDVGDESIIDLEPTIRAPRSEMWWLWNPKKKGSAVDTKFRSGVLPPRTRIAEMNFRDNKWFPKELDELRLHNTATRDPAQYAHIWEGAYLVNSEAQILSGKCVVEEFTPQSDWSAPRYGADWGFSVDPTALVKLWVHDNVLYIEHEAGGKGCELDDIPAMFDTVPGARSGRILADCSRPETISHVSRRGFHVEAAPKWAGSVEDGITFLRSFS
jgi:phage terminase large subunit